MNKLLQYLIVLACVSATLASTAQVTIVLDSVPVNTPLNEPIYIAGSFNGWNPASSSHKLQKIDDKYVVSLPSSTGTLQFKFTRGTWNSVESDANGSFFPNRLFSYAECDTIVLQVQGWQDLGGDGDLSTALSNVQILTDSFFIPQLNRYRRVWIYLPQSYYSSNQEYPVLYLHDGQNLFDIATSYSGEWEIDETLARLEQNGDSSAIVVGIDNGGSRRLDEYSPFRNPTYGGGEGAQYVDFIVYTLKPYIDSIFRTKSERLHTGILGSSMGGFISLYAGIQHQDIFSKIGVFSPSFWFSQQAYDHVSNIGKNADMRIYMVVGSLEGSTMVSNMQEMKDTILNSGFTKDELKVRVAPDGQHSEWFWGREFETAYNWMFNDSTDQETNLQQYYINDFEIVANDEKNIFHINFNLIQNTDIQVTVIDRHGFVVDELNNTMLEEGAHTFLWHGGNQTKGEETAIPSGMYICHIKIGGKDGKVIKKEIKY